MISRRMMFAVVAVLFSFAALAQRPPRPNPRIIPRPDPRATAELQRAVDIVKEWGALKAAQGALVCRFQAVLNSFIEIDNVMDPMQPNVSIAKANDRLALAGKLVPTNNDSVS